MKKQSLVCAVLCLLLFCTCAAAQDIPELMEPAGVQLNAVAAWIGDISKIRVFEGSVVPYTEEFYFEQEGVVDEVHVVYGQLVQAGDPLITLNTKAETKRLEAIRKEITQITTNGRYQDEIAQIDLDMMEVELRALKEQSPRDDAAVSLKQLDMEEKQLEMELNVRLREMSLAQLENEMAELEKEIARNVMTAPFDGRVIYMPSQLQHGSYVSAYTPLIYLADDTQLMVESVYIANSLMETAHALYAHVGANEYAITPVPVDEQEYLSKVLSGEELKVQFAISEPDELLSAGQYAVVCVETNFVPNVLLVPTTALYADENRYLYVIEDGVRVRRNVKIGLMTDWYTQIVEGLQEGELVYVQE